MTSESETRRVCSCSGVGSRGSAREAPQANFQLAFSQQASKLKRPEAWILAPDGWEPFGNWLAGLRSIGSAAGRHGNGLRRDAAATWHRDTCTRIDPQSVSCLRALRSIRASIIDLPAGFWPWRRVRCGSSPRSLSPNTDIWRPTPPVEFRWLSVPRRYAGLQGQSAFPYGPVAEPACDVAITGISGETS